MRKLLAAGAIACFSVTPVLAQDAVTPTAETVLAVVDGTEITLGHVILLRTQLPEQYLTAPDDLLFEGILEQLIDQTVLGNSQPEESLELRLTMENERRALQAATVIDGIISQDFGEGALQAAYDAAYGNLPAEPEFNASHILVETEEEAAALIASLEGGADFAELAKEKSTGPSGASGGELGWFGLGMMVAPFEEAVLSLEVGQISAPVQTQFGWHVLILNDARDKPAPTLEEVAGDLNAIMQQEALEAAVNELRDGAAIEITVEGIDPAAMRDLSLLNE